MPPYFARPSSFLLIVPALLRPQRRGDGASRNGAAESRWRHADREEVFCRRRALWIHVRGGTAVPLEIAYRTFLHVGTVRRDHSLRWQQSAYVGDFLGEFRNFRRVSARKTGLDPLSGDLRHSPRGLSQAFCLWRFDFVSQLQTGPLFVRHGALARGRRPELVRHTGGVVWYRPCGHAQYAWLHGLPGLGLRWRQADFDRGCVKTL